MKRYVRTSEGQIFDTEYEPKAFKYNWHAKFIIDDNNLIVYDTVFKDRIANHGQILKQSDTIEELCDKYILINRKEELEPYICDTYREAVELKGDDEDLFGAIWTTGEHSEPILKSVAKYNKGKFTLELWL